MIGPLSWVLIYVSDIDKTRHFYEKILDLPLKSVRPQIIVFRTGACTLELMAKLAAEQGFDLLSRRRYRSRSRGDRKARRRMYFRN
jgi:catechol 2,3-dioxygenase-like lactoylglutathione lyase family enzyme